MRFSTDQRVFSCQGNTCLIVPGVLYFYILVFARRGWSELHAEPSYQTRRTGLMASGISNQWFMSWKDEWTSSRYRIFIFTFSKQVNRVPHQSQPNKHPRHVPCVWPRSCVWRISSWGVCGNWSTVIYPRTCACTPWYGQPYTGTTLRAYTCTSWPDCRAFRRYRFGKRRFNDRWPCLRRSSRWAGCSTDCQEIWNYAG